MFLLEVGFSRVAPKHKATQHARVARGLPDKWKPKIETEGLRQGEWNLKMKSRLRLKVCEAEAGRMEFKDEV